MNDRYWLDYCVNLSDTARSHLLAGEGNVVLNNRHWIAKVLRHRCSLGADGRLNVSICLIEWMFLPYLIIDASVSQLDQAWTIRLLLFSRLMQRLDDKDVLPWQSNVSEHATMKAFAFALSQLGPSERRLTSNEILRVEVVSTGN